MLTFTQSKISFNFKEFKRMTGEIMKLNEHLETKIWSKIRIMKKRYNKKIQKKNRQIDNLSNFWDY